ncbi:MAG: pyridoxal phosphate-dependent aminotransferase [Candidatus Pacearchaeota archaeon]
MVHISERDLQLPELEFPKIFKRVVTDKNVISLGPGEPDFLTPAPLIAYGKQVLGKSTHYSEPSGLLELREALVKKLKIFNKIECDTDEVLVTSGSQEGLFSALLTALDPTEQVLVPSPGYVGYTPAIDLVSATPVFVPLKEEEKFALNPDVLKRYIDKKSEVLILNTPSNPTGTVMSRKLMEEIADIVIEKDLLVFSDEAYEDITYDGARHISMASLNGMKEHTVTFHTFSKSYAMCGFRLGYASGPKKFIGEMTKNHHYVSLTAPHISQLMGIKALSLSPKYMQSMVKEYDRRRKLIVNGLNDLGMNTHIPAGTFYAFSNIKDTKMNSSTFARKLLNQGGVAVIPGTEFGPFGEGYIRSSFATSYDRIETALERVGKFVSKS